MSWSLFYWKIEFLFFFFLMVDISVPRISLPAKRVVLPFRERAALPQGAGSNDHLWSLPKIMMLCKFGWEC